MPAAVSCLFTPKHPYFSNSIVVVSLIARSCDVSKSKPLIVLVIAFELCKPRIMVYPQK